MQDLLYRELLGHGELCWLDTESNIAVVFTQAAGLNDNLITQISMKTTSLEKEKEEEEVEVAVVVVVEGEHKIGRGELKERTRHTASRAVRCVH